VSPAVTAGVVAVSAILLVGGLVALPSPRVQRGRDFEHHVRARPYAAPGSPASLEELDRLVRWQLSTAGDVHFRLRPVLQEIAAHRLRHGHDVDLDGSPAVARRLLGEVTFEVVRPDRPAPPDRLAPGRVTLAELVGIVERLEAL
jgi:hypothetical protein